MKCLLAIERNMFRLFWCPCFAQIHLLRKHWYFWICQRTCPSGALLHFFWFLLLSCFFLVFAQQLLQPRKSIDALCEQIRPSTRLKKRLPSWNCKWMLAMMATKAWCDVSILLNIFNITHPIILNYHSQQWTTWWYTYSNKHVFNRHVAHICWKRDVFHQTTFLFVLGRSFLGSEGSIESGGGDHLWSPTLWWEHWSRKESPGATGGCFGEGGNLGPMSFLSICPPQKKAPGMAVTVITNHF